MKLSLSLAIALLVVPRVAFVAADDGAPAPFFETQRVLRQGTEGHHTFRLPCLVATRSGAVLLFGDGRVNGAGDLGKVNLVLKRSADGGATWQPLQVLATGPGPRKKIGNVSAVYDARRDAVHAIYCDDLTRAYCLTSTDDGVTFRSAMEITSAFDRFAPPWKFFATGHAHGIQLAGGRLVVPVFLSEVPRTGAGKLDKFHAGAIVSDDGAESWQPGGLVPKGNLLNESSIYQCADGSLVLNGRSTGAGRRMIAGSNDCGESWSEPELEESLYDCTCQASTLVVRDREDKRLVLFSNPAGPGRRNMTVRISRDEGRTWPLAVLIDENPSAYSDLAVGPHGTILLAYETGGKGPYETITVARFNLPWLLENAQPCP